MRQHAAQTTPVRRRVWSEGRVWRDIGGTGAGAGAGASPSPSLWSSGWRFCHARRRRLGYASLQSSGGGKVVPHPIGRSQMLRGIRRDFDGGRRQLKRIPGISVVRRRGQGRRQAETAVVHVIGSRREAITFVPARGDGAARGRGRLCCASHRVAPQDSHLVGDVTALGMAPSSDGVKRKGRRRDVLVGIESRWVGLRVAAGLAVGGCRGRATEGARDGLDLLLAAFVIEVLDAPFCLTEIN